MASKTTNYGLNKHSPQDFYSVEARNENWDKIDEALAATDPTKITAKDEPADGDGVMISDSADGGKAKRLLWSNVKAALGKLSIPLARKINGKTLTEDVTLTGENIAVSTTDSTPISGAVKYRTNPNLLDNWYFGNPVNQRGLTELASGNWDKYFIDRWFATARERVYAITDDGIKISNLQHKYDQLWNQELERVEKRTYTLSFLLKNIGLLSMTFTPQGADYTEQTLDGGFIVSFTSKANLTKPVIRLLESTSVTVSDVTILAVKLELGDTQTLAHKENGVWVLNEIPDFGEQLRRCQRFAIDDNYHTTVGQLNYDGDTYYISAQFPCVMRTTPVITLKEISAMGWGALPVSNAEVVWRDTNGFFVGIKDLSNMNNFIGKSCSVTYFASADL
ncbi:hypothetical protein AAAV51_04525 [Agathobaculum butyriciproducens]|uniref:Uncharacterized protein n=1 Tax=Agathobaculum butyriciproducens TaxID=1628085 RepID=A0AAW4VXD5_9FIRM|nr:hypothetical protein [Agathobaculum butyriciproducens]